MDALLKAIRDAASRLTRAAAAVSMNEQSTRASLIDPVLRALGWDIGDPDDVQHEYRVKRADNPVDYALLVNGAPKLFVEAKALGRDLADRKWSNQIMGYAAVAGVEWVALTNGDEWRIYRALAAVDVDSKLLLTAKVSEDADLAARVLRLLSKREMGDSKLDGVWKMRHVDRQVEGALNRLLRAGRGDDLMKLVSTALPKLQRTEIAQSLARVDIRVSFPRAIDLDGAEAGAPVRLEIRGGKGTRKSGAGAVSVGTVVGGEGPGERRGESRDGSRSGGRTSISLADLIANGVIRPPLEIFAKYYGVALSARIEADGTVSFEGERHASLTAAANAARRKVLDDRAKGGGKRTGGGGRVARADESRRKPPADPAAVATNGWAFWNFASEDGKETSVGELRQAIERSRTVVG
jgi:hypothetical protein